MQSRLKKIRQILTAQSVDAILISSVPNVMYLSGYNGFVPEERDAFVLITQKNAYIFTNLLYAEAMETAVPHLQLIEITRDAPFSTGLHQLIKKHAIKTLGYEENDLTVSEYKRLLSLPITLKNIDLHTLRLYKFPAEIASIEKACTITDATFTYLLNKIKPGITETHVEQLIERVFIEHGASTAFRSIVAFGKNTTIPHHLSGPTKLQKNDVILIDFGAKVDSYCADVSRTFFIGSATKKQKEIYTVVAQTQQYICEKIENCLRTNLPLFSNELDKEARDYIAKKNYPPFPYSLGHGIGLQVHERPLLNPRFTDTLSENMVFTLEPGIHLTGEIGVRIEDDYVIKKNKLVQLSNSSKDLIIL